MAAQTQGKGKWHAFLTGIVQRPNEWGHTRFYYPRVSAKQYASNIRSGFQHGRFPLYHADGKEVLEGDGYFEASYDERPIGSGQWVVWARWIPNPARPSHTTPAKEVRRAVESAAGRRIAKEKPRRSSRR